MKVRRKLSRISFYLHLWLGVIVTVALVAISVTGILLNHKRGLGLMPDVPHEPTAPFDQAIPVERMAHAALLAVPQEARGDWKPGDPVDVALMITLITGYWLWLAPKAGRDRSEAGEEE